MSKQSILAKHLFFYSREPGFDLKSEAGRQAFLEQRCHILVKVTSNREEARELEKHMERSGAYRFVGLASSFLPC